MERDANLLFGNFLAENYMKMKEIGLRRVHFPNAQIWIRQWKDLMSLGSKTNVVIFQLRQFLFTFMGNIRKRKFLKTSF